MVLRHEEPSLDLQHVVRSQPQTESRMRIVDIDRNVFRPQRTCRGRARFIVGRLHTIRQREYQPDNLARTGNQSKRGNHRRVLIACRRTFDRKAVGIPFLNRWSARRNVLACRRIFDAYIVFFGTSDFKHSEVVLIAIEQSRRTEFPVRFDTRKLFVPPVRSSSHPAFRGTGRVFAALGSHCFSAVIASINGIDHARGRDPKMAIHVASTAGDVRYGVGWDIISPCCHA